MILSPMNPKLKAVLLKIEDVVMTAVFYPVYLLGNLLDWFERATWPPEQTWQRWFAWYPVRIGLSYNGSVVWMEWVERTKYCRYPIYRRFGDESFVPPWVPSPEEG